MKFIHSQRVQMVTVCVAVIVTAGVVIGVRSNSRPIFQIVENTGGKNVTELRQKAHLPSCVDHSSHPLHPINHAIHQPWESLSTICLATGAPTTVGQVLEGKRVFFNMWAYWCGFCLRELPAINEFAKRHSDVIRVVLVHEGEKDDEALRFLTQRGIRLPTITDHDFKIKLSFHTPQVLPVSLIIAPDGTVERMFTSAFHSVAEIEKATNIPS